MNCVFVPNFEAIGYVTLAYDAKIAPKVGRKKRSHLKTALNTAKNISHGCMS